MCNLLDGVFAFALCYDGEFLAARDPIGVKQMYYGIDKCGRYFFRLVTVLEFKDDYMPIGDAHITARGFTNLDKLMTFSVDIRLNDLTKIFNTSFLVRFYLSCLRSSIFSKTLGEL